jgi:hypothetical protein
LQVEFGEVMKKILHSMAYHVWIFLGFKLKENEEKLKIEKLEFGQVFKELLHSMAYHVWILLGFKLKENEGKLKIENSRKYV